MRISPHVDQTRLEDHRNVAISRKQENVSPTMGEGQETVLIEFGRIKNAFPFTRESLGSSA